MSVPVFTHPYHTKVVDLELRPIPEHRRRYSFIKITPAPRFARVRISGENVGLGPVQMSHPIDQLIRVEILEDGYQYWTRSYYPAPGRILVQPILSRISLGAAQLTVIIDQPDMPGTRIYLGPNEIGADHIERLAVDADTYEMTIAFRPPADSPIPNNRRSRFEIALPPDLHTTVRYQWSGIEWIQLERFEEPIVDEP